MKVLVTGAHGQLGRELADTIPLGFELHALARQALDIGDPYAVTKWITSHRPDVVINAASYNAVDRAETDRDTAFNINCEAPGYLAKALLEAGAGRRLIHVSTDYVFDGAQGRPYRPDDPPRPLNFYGETKLGGARRVLETLNQHALVIRSSRVYSNYGANFVKTMIRLMREREEVRVVSDQIGTPTWARGLARLIWTAAERPEVHGIRHWTDAGVASWYDFAVAIQEEALGCGILSRGVPVLPIGAQDFAMAAARPSYSVLDKRETWRECGYVSQHWRTALRTMLQDFADV